MYPKLISLSYFLYLGPEITYVQCSRVKVAGLTHQTTMPILHNTLYILGSLNGVKLREICRYLSFNTLPCPQRSRTRAQTT
jgi:hypothetical protein